MKIQRHIRLNTIKKIKEFVAMSERYSDGNVDITIESGRYNIDGRSIMGIFSLNIMAPMVVTISSEDVNVIMEIDEDLKKYIAD